MKQLRLYIIILLLGALIIPSVVLADDTSPVVSGIAPKSDVVPGVTRICVKGKNFGTSAQGWTTASSITVGGVDIIKAAWTDSSICFTAPESLPYGNQMMSIFLHINNGSTSGDYGGSIITIGGVLYPDVIPNDTYINKQYYLYNINAFNGWSIQPNGNNVVVAVIDDGIYINHPDLKQNIWVNQKEIIGNGKDDDNNGYVDDIYGWNFISNTGEMTTMGNHGTMVAGIIGATKNNSFGIAGIASGVKLMPLIACDDQGVCPTDAVIKAIRYAADNGANIINLSLGSTGTTTYTDKYNDAIRYAYNKGVVIVAAAGNGDTQGDLSQNTDQIPVSPVCNDNGENMVLGVSGTDEMGMPLLWVNYGSCVDVVAPAYQIASTTLPDSTGYYFYAIEDGTWFATPMVTGLAALLKSKYPSMSNSEIIDRIIRNATDRPEYNRALGAGMINIYKTLQENYTPPVNPIPVVSCPTNSSNINGKCNCNDGYVSSESSCITYNQNCQDQYGYNSYGDKTDCYCNTGYEMNSDKTACIKKVVQQQTNNTEVTGQQSNTKEESTVVDKTPKEDNGNKTQNSDSKSAVNSTVNNNQNKAGFFGSVSNFFKNIFKSIGNFFINMSK